MILPVHYPNTVILKKFIAVLMALVIASPACCCAFTSHFQSPQAIARSCCSNNDSHKQHQSCSCSLDKKKSSPEADFNLAAPVGVDLPLAPAPSTELFLTTLPEAVAFLKKWPPGDLPIPTNGSRLAAKCSYLI